MKLIIGTILAGSGVFAGANLPNPDIGACELADAVVHRSTPTMIAPDGEITSSRLWLVCGYQYPGASGVVNKDDTFVLELDADQATVVVEAASELAPD